MPAQVEVEDVEAGAREVIGKAAGGQVPCVAILPEPVHQQHRSSGALRAGRALAHHRERHATSSEDDFLHEGARLVPIDVLLDDFPVKDHLGPNG
jgi:hypothetical protein